MRCDCMKCGSGDTWCTYHDIIEWADESVFIHDEFQCDSCGAIWEADCWYERTAVENVKEMDEERMR